MIRLRLPVHLQRLAGVEGEVRLEIEPSTLGALLDALETEHPVLKGTIRDRFTGRRRPFVRFFACEQDLSHQGPETPLPEPITTGDEPFLVIGAMAGG